MQGGDDTVYAGGGDDIVVAGAGNDSVYGGSGNDEIKGDSGNDALDGGDGNDTAVFSGNSADYVIAPSSTGYIITDANSDGSDTLTGIELAKFKDGLFSFNLDGTLNPVTTVINPNPTNNPGLAVITGIAANGQTLTAKVTDLDGVTPGTESYDWQKFDGLNWISVGSGEQYLVSAADTGTQIQVSVTYTDDKGNYENPISAPKLVVPTSNDDFTVTLLNLNAPIGASVMNPLTTGRGCDSIGCFAESSQHLC
jgi:Ca2+-binding RTX toxin-like protein